MTMRLRHGVHAQLEEAANELIKESLKGVTSIQAKSDILTPWKEIDRKKREVMVPSGSPDAALRRGNYHRAYNRTSPHLNAIDGVARGGAGRRIPMMSSDDAESGFSPAPSVSWDEE